MSAAVLHVLALGPAVLAVACTPARGRGGRVALTTGLLMLVAMTDVALVPGGLPGLAWTAALLAAAVVLARTLRHAPVAEAGCRGHVLHVGCLLTMATLTASMAGPAAVGPAAAARHHTTGVDTLTVLGLSTAVAFVVASCVAAAGAVPRTADRVGALAGAGSVALMAAAVIA